MNESPFQVALITLHISLDRFQVATELLCKTEKEQLLT